jgi:RimJ/RimL family protein N-acetyltransferase
MNDIALKRVSKKDIETLLFIEKSLGNLKTYSPIITDDEMTESLEKSVKYIIEKDGVVVGSYSYEIKSKDVVNIGGPAILPEFQGQGIAKEITQIILEELKDYKRIDLEIHPDNLVSLKLFKSFGFVVESRIENYFGDGEPRLILSRIKI